MSISVIQSSTFTGTTMRHARSSHASGLGKILLTVPAFLQRWHDAHEMRKELAALDLRQLDDIGITPADRDALLRS